MRSHRPVTPIRGRRAMHGAMLIEALVAILIFSIGILGLVSLQATAVAQSSDARYRFEASQLANQVVGEMWVSNRNIAALQAAYNTCPDSSCLGYYNWASTIPGKLPGVVLGGLTKPTINVDNTGIVTVTVTWKAPADDSSHQYSFEAQVAQ